MSTKDHPDWWRPVGGQNSQDSVLERRSLVWNDNDLEDGEDPPAFYTCTTYKGKFYPRGMRGMIEQIEIYCRDAGQDTLTLRYSPHPGLGPIGEITISPLVGWAWRGADIEEMWNYDSLFIWVYECEAGVDWAYDAVEPYDGHWSQDAGATWEDMAIRPFIRAIYTGETPGDVPISGIINNIPIPAKSSINVFESETIGIGVDVSLYRLEGIGYCDLILGWISAAANSHMTRFSIRCDEVDSMNIGLNNLNAYGIDRNSPGFALPAYAVDGMCSVLITHKFEFRRSFEIFARNNFAGLLAAVRAYPTLLR